MQLYNEITYIKVLPIFRVYDFLPLREGERIMHGSEKPWKVDFSFNSKLQYETEASS